MEIFDEEDEDIKELMRRISEKEITLCDSCDTFFDYVPQKISCDECSRKKIREYQQRPEVKERVREQQREYYHRPEVKERVRERQRKYEQRPEVKERRREAARKRYHRPDVKAKARERYRRWKKLREEE